MERDFDGRGPDVADSAFVSEMAYLVGDVEVGAGSSLWPFVCLRGDGGTVTVGEDTNVQEFSTLHGATLGDRVSIGHSVTVDYATVEDDALVGINAAVLRGATVESNSLVGAGALVLEGQTVPEGHFARGAPAEVEPLGEDRRKVIDRTAQHYVERGRRFAEEGLE
jgi:carbonic anhydrase/acetyltransferase-like protein (isoleucine patch superfamily)